MASTRITSKRIASSKTKAARSGNAIYLWDTELKGFGVFLSPKGTVTWLVQKWQGGLRGKATRLSIGRYPALSIDEARREASQLINDAYRGIDIALSRKKQINNMVHSPMLGDVVQRYLDARDDGSRYWKDNRARLLNKFVQPLGSKTRISDITKADIKPLVATDVQLFATVRPFVKWALAEDIITASPLETIPKPKPFPARDRILSDEEVRVFWKSTEKLGYPYCQFYRLLLLTGQRREEVAGIAWREMKECVWTIPRERTKTNKEHIVPLSPFALELINSLPVFAKRRDYLFTPPKGKGLSHISGYSKTKKRLDGLMKRTLPKIRPWRVHDLRRTCASGMARLGIAPSVIEKVLNHNSGVNSGLVGVYQRYDYLTERKDALETWGSCVRRLVRSEPEGGAYLVDNPQRYRSRATLLEP